MTQEEFEETVMDKLLDCEDNPFNNLKKQYLNSSITSREFTGCGFFTSFHIPDELVINSIQGEIFDVIATFEGSDEQYGFRLTVSNGRIDTLEGFAMSGEWKHNYEKASLDYTLDDRRCYSLR